MAKGYGLTGKVRGKVGAQVYRIVNGKQIISEYNPTKSVSPSTKQVENRSSMSLVYQFSRVFPFECIVGFSPIRSDARSMFVASLRNIVEGSWNEPTRYEPTLDETKVQLSKGVAVPVLSTRLRSTVISDTTIVGDVTFSLNSGVANFLMVVLMKSNATGEYVRAEQVLSADVSAGQPAAARLVISESAVVSGYSYICYAVPLVPNTADKRVVYGRLMAESGATTLSTDVLVELKRRDIYGASIYLGSLTL